VLQGWKSVRICCVSCTTQCGQQDTHVDVSFANFAMLNFPHKQALTITHTCAHVMHACLANAIGARWHLGEQPPISDQGANRLCPTTSHNRQGSCQSGHDFGLSTSVHACMHVCIHPCMHPCMHHHPAACRHVGGCHSMHVCML
jgi:hypothetical protein